jgi:hypothetical protein
MFMSWLCRWSKRRGGLAHPARRPATAALRLEWLEDRTVPSFTITNYALATGSGPSDVISADFRNLGTADIAVANQTNSTVSVLLNNHDGTGTFAPAVSYSTSAPGAAHPFSLAAGDLNGDGFADIVMANYGAAGAASTKVSILYNDPANPGTFMPAVTLDVGDGYIASVKLASLKGDGLLDIITANESSNPTGTVTVLLQDRNNPGTFLAPVTYPTGPANAMGNNSPQGLAVADFYGDGFLSVAVGDALTSKITILRGDGSGALAPYTVVGTAPSGIFGGLAAGDLGTGGGNTGLSLVSANNGTANVSVFVNDGLGNFAPPVNYAAGPFPTRLTIGKVGASGFNDVVTANNDNPGTISILYGNGDGTLQLAVTQPSGGNGPSGVAIADVEGDLATDSLNDILVSNRTSDSVTVLIQSPSPAPAPAPSAHPGSVSGGLHGQQPESMGVPVQVQPATVLSALDLGGVPLQTEPGTALTARGLDGISADGTLLDGTAVIDSSAAADLFGDPVLGGPIDQGLGVRG